MKKLLFLNIIDICKMKNEKTTLFTRKVSMKIHISPLISKIASVGTTLALINNGADPQMASYYSQLAEGMVSGFVLENKKEDVMTKLQKIFVDSTFQILRYEINVEIEFETAKKIAEILFKIEHLYEYIASNDSETLIIERFKKCCLEYGIPYIEQNLDINTIIKKILFEIHNYIINDIHFILIILLINMKETRQDIADIKKYNENSVNNRHVLFKYNQKEQFIKKWKSSLFLHKDIKLCDIYTQANFICKQIKTGKLENLILTYLSDSSKQVLFLFGNPGLGKSSLMSYLAYIFRDIDKYIFIKMHDLEPRIAKDSLLDAVLDFLDCKRRDLENVVIFLDGYDELRVDSKHYELCIDFITELKQIKAKALISSRLNYIDLNKNDFKRDFANTVVVELKPFKKQQMFEYIERYGYISKESIDNVKRSFENRYTETEVYGIPFILYLICSLNIDINQMTDMYSIYDKVFAFDGGLYDKIYDEEAGHYLTQNPKCKRDLFQISMEIAYSMFRMDNLYIDMEYLEKEIISKYPQRKNTYALGNYYYIENDKLYFVHKTFQEYFTCHFLLASLENLLDIYISNNTRIVKTAQNIFDILYCDNYLFKRIEHIFSNMFENSKLIQNEKYKDAFCSLIPWLYDLYINNIYMDRATKNNILKSQNYLASLHKIINLFKTGTFRGVKPFDISIILRNKYYVIMNIYDLKLDNVDLSGAYLRGTFNKCEFVNINFCRCDLHNTNINNVCFSYCKLGMVYGKRINLNNAKLLSVKLMYSNFTEANFNEVDFQNSTIKGMDFSYSVFNSCTFKNVKFVDCNFSNSCFNNIDTKIRFYECNFQNTVFENTTADLSFHDCYEGNKIIEV